MNSMFFEKYNQFVNSLLVYALDNNKKDNIVLSPMSLWILMQILAESCSGKTKQEIIDSVTNNLNLDTNKDESILKIANAIFMKDDNNIKESFVKLFEDKYNGRIFISNNLIVEANKWVNKITNGMIDKIIDENNLSEFGIANAIAFDSKWAKPYENNNIENNKFHNKNGSVSNIAFLNSIEDYYIEDNSVIGFVKPYKDNKYSFVAMLPKDNNINTIDILNSINITDLYNNKTNEYELHVEFPEFDTSSSFNLKDYCMSLGINEIFTNNADFSQLTNKRVKLADIIHKAVIEVNRKGTKAVAVSYADIFAGSIPDFKKIKEIVLDRPFIYAIVDNNTGLIIFAGAVNNL